MNKHYGHLLGVLALTLTAFACGRAPQGGTSNLHEVHEGSGTMNSLGLGFDSIKGEVTGNHCLGQLPTRRIPINEGSLKFYHDLSGEELKDHLSGSIEIGVPVYPGIMAKGGVGFANDYASNDFSETFVLHYQGKVEQERVYFEDITDDSISLAPLVSRMLADESYTEAEKEQALSAMCGDQYVAMIEKGINLLAVLKISYSSRQDKNAYSGMLGAEVLRGVVDIKSSTEYEREKLSRELKVELAVFQRGGKPVGLLKTFAGINSGDEGEYQPFLQCGFDSRKVCFDAYRRIMDHARNISFDETILKSLAPIQITTQTYPLGGIASLVRPSDHQLQNLAEAKAQLNHQRRKFLTIYGDISLEESRLNDISNNLELFLSKEFSQRLQEAIRLNSQAIALAEKTYQVCWSHVLSVRNFREPVAVCSDAVDDLFTKYYRGDLAIDQKVLDPRPETFVEWCLLSNTSRLLSLDERLSYQKVKNFIKDQLICNYDSNQTCLLELNLDQLIEEDDPTRSKSIRERIAAMISGNSDIETIFDQPTEQEFRNLCGIYHDAVGLEGFDYVDLSFDANASDDFKIATLSPLRSLPKLKTIVARNNLISSFEGLEDQTTPNPDGIVDQDIVNRLEQLDLSGNRISDVELMRDLPWASLTRIDLSDNDLFEVPNDLSFITVDELVLAYNPWDTLDGALIVADDLKILDISDISLQALSIIGSPNLTIVANGYECTFFDITWNCVRK